MANDPTKKGGFRPPAPAVLRDVPATAKPRPFNIEIPRTAGSVDPNIEAHDSISRRKARSDFRHGGEDFIRLLLQHGKRVTWRKALLCPCLRADTGQVDLACTECDGSGYVYLDPLPIQAHMVAFDKKTRLYEKFGLWAEGQCSVTVEPSYRLGYRDSLECTDSLMNFQELLRKDDRHGRRQKLPAGEDAARYRISAIARALYQDRAGKIRSLEQGEHFTLTDSGHIRWQPAGEKLLRPGDIFSVHYDFHPVFIVVSHPHVTRDDLSGTKTPVERVISLPISAACQLDFLNSTDEASKPLPVTGAV